MAETTGKYLIFSSAQEAFGLLGEKDKFLQILKDSLACEFVSRGDRLEIRGDAKAAEQAWQVMAELQYLYRQGYMITAQEVSYALAMVQSGQGDKLHFLLGDAILVAANGRQLRPKTIGQREYLDVIRRNAITLAVGPAGTGKTYLAVVMAVAYLRRKQVNKIILTRPAVEADEHLGFLPGDMQEKVDPYLRPLYDALQDTLGLEQYRKHIERGVIEIAPLAYMRGRTLDDAFVILDEGQNATSRQMKMFLTRLGFGSTMVVTGDLGQIDLPRNTESGLKVAWDILANVKGVGRIELKPIDIIRHQVVTNIVAAYEKYEGQKGK